MDYSWHLAAVWSWGSYLTSLSLCVLGCGEGWPCLCPGKLPNRASDTRRWESRPSFPVLWVLPRLCGFPATGAMPGGRGEMDSVCHLWALGGPWAQDSVRLSTQDLEKGQVDFCRCGVLKTIWKGHVGGDVGRRKALSGAEFSVLARLMGPLSGGHRRRGCLTSCRVPGPPGGWMVMVEKT